MFKEASFLTQDKTMDKVFIGEVTPEQIEVFKTQHKVVHKLTGESGVYAIVRRPTMKEIEYGQAMLAQNKFISYNMYLFNACLLALSEDIRDDEYKANAFASQMMLVVETERVEVEKL